MSTYLAKAYPKKSFFIQMFTKDVSLEDCVLDLIDNSIDGLMKTQGVRLSSIAKNIFRKNGNSKTKKGLPLINIEYSQNEVSIEDKCGGIDWNYALTEVFNFGHSQDQQLGYLGAYGVGLKRALFKIGNNFHITSRTLYNGFICDLDVDRWLVKDDTLDDWKIALQPTNKARNISSAGTTIRITKLHKAVKMRLKDPVFKTRLFKSIQRTYAFFLRDYIRIKVKGEDIKPFNIPVGKPRQGTVSYEELEKDNVKVRILATVARKDELERFSPESAGWYVICNGRIVLAADKSEKSGWNTNRLPQFHTKYSAFIGLVFFESKDPLLLPWTTTKRDLNQESAIYLHVKDRMALAARPIISFCNRKYGPDRDEEPIEREISKEVIGLSLGDLKTKRPTLFEATPTNKPKVKTTTRIQYDAQNTHLERIKKHLRKTRISANAIGRYTFQYFLKQEGLK